MIHASAPPRCRYRREIDHSLQILVGTDRSIRATHKTMTRGIAFVLIAMAGCGPSSGRGNPPGNGGATLMTIEVQPADATIAIDNGSGNAPVAYTAIGHFSDGKMQ